MTGKLLESGAISAFCSSVATMLAAGVQTDEAVHMLAENREQSEFKRVCDAVGAKVVEGSNLADAMQATPAPSPPTQRKPCASARHRAAPSACCAASGATTIAKAVRSPSCATRSAIRRRCCAS